VDVYKIREDFPMFKKMINEKPLIYLDSAATAQKPQCVIDTITHFYQEEYGTVHRALYELVARSTERYDGVRAIVKRFINAREEAEIVYTKGTTEGINLVASSFGKAFIKERDEVIVSLSEHHSNFVPWQQMCTERGARLKVIPIDGDGNLKLEEFEKLLSRRTKIVSIAHMTNSTGTIYPVKKIIEMAHNVGARVMLDGAQAISHLAVDVQDLDVDFYAFSGHKLYGPTGVGILYGKLDLFETIPPFLSGGDMVEKVTVSKTTYQPPPLKFEAGTPAIAAVIGLGVAIDYVQAIGIERIEQWEKGLLSYATKKLLEIEEVRIIGTAREKGGIISFTIKGRHPLDIGVILGLKGVAIRTGTLCAQPTLKHFGVESLARISFGIYNTQEDIDAFIHALKEAMILLRSSG
jgi:cysteine desulfurase/selenocysteine lyase